MERMRVMLDEEKVGRYAGQRCNVCSDPATCTGPAGPLCDECCDDGTGHCHREACKRLDQDDEVRQILGVA